MCVEIAGLIARGATRAKETRIVDVSVTSRRFSLQQRQHRRQLAVRGNKGYHGVLRGITAIGNLQLHRWKFISMASAIMSGHLFARPSGPRVEFYW